MVMPKRYVIRPDFAADKDYIDTGVSEGWLIFDGYREDQFGDYTYFYIHAPP